MPATVYRMRQHQESTGKATPSPDLLRAFASYSWIDGDDTETVGRLACELRLRGLTVFRDVESFTPGAPIERTIRAELARCAVVTPLLTPASLASDPVVEMEFKSARDLRRDHGRPALVPVVRNLGASQLEVTANTWGRLKYDFAANWTPLATAGGGPLEIGEVAEIALRALRAAMPPGNGPSEGAWRVSVATRGERPAGEELVIDATAMLGGPEARPGTKQQWARVAAGIRDLEKVLGEHGRRSGIVIEPHCHLSAAVAAGHAFRFAGGWHLTVEANATTLSRGNPEDSAITPTVEDGAFTDSSGTLAVIIDLVPRGIHRSATDSFASPPRATLHYTRTEAGQLSAAETADLAVRIAHDIKRRRGELKAARIDMYLCAPAAFAVLLGAELGAVGCPIQLHEAHEDTYIPSVELPR